MRTGSMACVSGFMEDMLSTLPLRLSLPVSTCFFHNEEVEEDEVAFLAGAALGALACGEGDPMGAFQQALQGHMGALLIC